MGFTKKDRDTLIAIVKRGPCFDCKVTSFPIEQMQFDHRDPRQKKILMSKVLRTGSLAEILDEINKCDLVCANCHHTRSKKQYAAGIISLLNSGRPRKLVDANKLQKLVSQNLSPFKIGEILGVSRMTICRRLKKMGKV